MKLGNDEGIAKLFFELASENRLGILNELQTKTLKMQEIARKLDVTATEALRQLQRLSVAQLVQRQSDGSYATTHYGKLVLQLSSSIEFTSRYKDYFSTHDIMQLPYQFLNRIGELSQATFVMDTIENLNWGQRLYTEAEQYTWGLAEGIIPESMGPIMDEKTSAGLDIRMLVPKTFVMPPATEQNIEVRGLSDIPASIALTEKGAIICFRFIEGRLDYAGFSGTDPVFVNWVRDLFLYYWDKGK